MLDKDEEIMANQTKENILKKRKASRKRRRVKYFRLLFVLILMALLCSAVLFVGYTCYRWAGKLYQEYNVMYQEYTERKESRGTTSRAGFAGYTNILIMGLDDGADPNLPSDGQNADTIMLLSFANDTGRSRFIMIPRDTWITTPDGGGIRIGSLYSTAGPSGMVRQISSLLGISIHQYITLDMQTFAELVDILDGIDIYVEEDMDYDDPESGFSIHLKRGYQHLDGWTAQGYLRYRGTELGDMGRVQRQQKFVKALYEKILQFSTIPKLPAIADVFQHRMVTSAEIFDSAHLANVLRRMNSEMPNAITLPGNYAPADDTIWIPDQEGIRDRMKELFPENERTDEE